ncbi:MAG: CaiB/BaiF CoA transferase family protein, partial [Alphaproteobacteria bacterium]
FRLDHGGGRIDSAPAVPGQDNESVLAEAGFSAEEIAGFKTAGVA